MDKKKIIAAVVVLLIAVDLYALLYPKVSDYINTRSQSRAVVQYYDDVAGTGSENMLALLTAANDYNKRLVEKADRFKLSDGEIAEYEKQLDTGRGVLGTLTIAKINVELPIYHGTDEGVLQVGLGHLMGSSLPVGGAGTHAIITGHRGLPSSTLLSDLDRMELGDTFSLFIMGETLTYQVDEIKTVEPDEKEALDIYPDGDYCTLVTCTPYGINTHRLLVRGGRMENAGSFGWENLYADASMPDKINVVAMFIIPVLPVIALFIIIKCRKIYKGGLVL
ncbi:MAG: class C sortase [Clostridiales bacterium]|nr:class C sortase [Clostridiales bacterium]